MKRIFVALCCALPGAATRYHLLTYATPSHLAAAHRLKQSALDVGGFHEAHVFEPDVLDSEYRRRNEAILQQARGAGFWIYKPYVIMRYMHGRAALEDVVCYMDALYEFQKNFSGLVETWLSSSPVPIALTVNKPDEGTFYEKAWSKNDAFVIMGADVAWGDTLQAWCGFVCFRNSFPALQYIAEWLTYTQDARIVTDSLSQFGTERDSFRENRHDQTVCSLLAKKYNITMQSFPATFVYNHHLHG